MDHKALTKKNRKTSLKHHKPFCFKSKKVQHNVNSENNSIIIDIFGQQKSDIEKFQTKFGQFHTNKKVQEKQDFHSKVQEHQDFHSKVQQQAEKQNPILCHDSFSR